jgi:hypothetical protein
MGSLTSYRAQFILPGLDFWADGDPLQAPWQAATSRWDVVVLRSGGAFVFQWLRPLLLQHLLTSSDDVAVQASAMEAAMPADALGLMSLRFMPGPIGAFDPLMGQTPDTLRLYELDLIGGGVRRAWQIDNTISKDEYTDTAYDPFGLQIIRVERAILSFDPSDLTELTSYAAKNAGKRDPDPNP